MKNTKNLTDQEVINRINTSCNCPFCGGYLDAGALDIDGANYNMNIICADCGIKYIETGKLVCNGFEILDKDAKVF